METRCGYPDPDGLLRETGQIGYKLNLWEHAFTHPESPLYKPLFPWSGRYKVFGGLVPDFATPEARKIFADHHEATLFAKGVSGFKLDECDHQPIKIDPWSFPEQAAFPSGLDGEQMHLLIGPLYQRTMEAIYRRHNQRTLGLVRASGAVAAPLPFALYSDAYDHRDYVRAIATSGFAGQLWCPEVRDMASLDEFYRRLETCVFCAVTQVDCWYLKNPVWKQINKDLNNKGKFMDHWEQTEAACRKILQLRMRLLPYLYAAYGEYRYAGVPPTRALVMDYPEDPAVANDRRPVHVRSLADGGAAVRRPAAKRSVYLPKGDWYDFWTGQKYAGGRNIEVEKPLEQIPVFVKGGTLLPLAEPVEYVDADDRVRPDGAGVWAQAAAVRALRRRRRDVRLREGRAEPRHAELERLVRRREQDRRLHGPSRYKIVGWTRPGK